MSTYAMDVVYKSDIGVVTTDFANYPISMAYGFVGMGQGGSLSNKDLGEKPKQGMSGGDYVTFSFYDLASPPTTINKIVISSVDITNPDQPNNASPFDGQGGWSTGVLTLTGSQIPGFGSGQSAGCNVQTSGFNIGAFQAQNKQGKILSYEITITVYVPWSDGTTRIFQVDPEVDVASE